VQVNVASVISNPRLALIPKAHKTCSSSHGSVLWEKVWEFHRI